MLLIKCGGGVFLLFLLFLAKGETTTANFIDNTKVTKLEGQTDPLGRNA